ncbi:lipase [Lysobacter firmicutimachus]|uniref:Lipase n=1 Tax=Lysobacter firmicutimachus TaxID=1792846 RepID=A0AAU8MRZ4_9GAMM
MSLSSQQYANLAEDAYNPREKGKDVTLEGVTYTVLKHVDKPSGYQGTIYRRQDTGEIIVAHRGTEFDREKLKDGLTDAGMVTSRTNVQAKDAIALTRDALEIAEELGRGKPSRPEVTVTGHSLGGTLAQITAHHYDLRGETFNAYGAVSLGYRIPEGGNRVTNHVMAGDPVSAASDHYGQVKVYATAQEVKSMRDSGYENDRSTLFDARSSVGAAKKMVGTSHSMHNFLNVDAHDKPDRSVLGDPQAQRLAQQYDPMIDKYRNDIESLRRGVTNTFRDPVGKAGDLIDEIRGPLKPGEPGRKEHRHEAPARPERNASPWHPAPYGPALRDYIHPGKTPTVNPGFPMRATTSLDDNPSAFVDRMLAASQNGDRDAFRQMTQQAAAATPGRELRNDAVATVDRQEQALAQQAMQQQANEQATPSRQGPRMG